MPFHPLVSEMDSSISEFGHIHCWKMGCKSKIKNRTANSVETDEMDISSESTLYAKVCRSDRDNIWMDFFLMFPKKKKKKNRTFS